MMHQQQPKKVYISRSLLTDINLIRKFTFLLKQKGYNAYFYNDSTYNDNLVRQADLILVYPYDGIGNVGKGQFTETQLAKLLSKPVFFVDQSDLNAVLFEVGKATLKDVNSWKRNYASFEVTNTFTSLDKYLKLWDNVSVDDELLLIVEIN